MSYKWEYKTTSSSRSIKNSYITFSIFYKEKFIGVANTYKEAKELIRLKITEVAVNGGVSIDPLDFSIVDSVTVMKTELDAAGYNISVLKHDRSE